MNNNSCAESLGVMYRCMELRIRALHPEFRWFHLIACGGCGAPAFQQPCTVCDYYPMGDAEEQREARADMRQGMPFTQAELKFILQVEDSGNVASWYVMRRIASLDKAIKSSGRHIDQETFALMNQWENTLKVAYGMRGLPCPSDITIMARARAHQMRMAGELRVGDSVFVLGNQEGTLKKAMFTPGPYQSTHQDFTFEMGDGKEFKVTAAHNEEFRLV